MDKLNEAIGTLAAVVSTMDTITVVGIDNQDKFVGCALSIQAVKNRILEYINSVSNAEDKEEKDG